MSALYEHACRLYDALDALANDEKLEDDRPVRVFRGSVSDVYKSVEPRLSMAHWSPLFKGLYGTGSVIQLQKGARNTKSVYTLHHRPDADAWRRFERHPLSRRMDIATLRQTVNEIEEMLEEVSLRETLPKLVEAVEGLTARVEALEPK